MTARVCDQAAWLEALGLIGRSQPSAREAGRVYIKTKKPVTANKVEADTGIFIPRKSGELCKIKGAVRTEYCMGCLQIKDLREINLERFQVDDGRVTL